MYRPRHNRLNGEWTVKLAIITCECAFDWTVDYLDHFAIAYKSSLLATEGDTN